MRRIATAGVLAALALAVPAAAHAEGIIFFSNPGKTVICRYSSFSGYQELKCEDKVVAGDDGYRLVIRLQKTGKGAELLFDANPIEKEGSVVRKFAKAPFTCTLAKTQVRCTNPQKHGFVMTTKAGSVF